MTNYLIPILTSGAALAGAVAGGVQAVLAARQARAATAEVRRLGQNEELQVLQSDDLTRLGRYLYETIGPTRISNYVGNMEVRSQVSRALDGVFEFLGTEETEISPAESAEAAQEVGDSEAAQTAEEEAIKVLDEPETEELSEMQKALHEITFGEVWNGLARMRRYIEGQLADIALERSEWRRLSAGRLLTRLRQAGYISDRTEKLLRYAIDVANAGIHGGEIEVGQAQEAWESAVRGLTMLSQQRPAADDDGFRS